MKLRCPYYKWRWVTLHHGLSNNGPEPVSSVVLTQEESISNASRLQEVHIEIVGGKPCKPRGPSAQLPRARASEAIVTDLSRSKCGRNLVLRAGIDKCNWWMDLPKRKGKSKVLSRGAKTKKKETLLPNMFNNDSPPFMRIFSPRCPTLEMDIKLRHRLFYR
ncbi:hypothetical protein V6N11_067497 [Hibiscus sabdariffa]|uniref:Uncharacterized protein n=1 Tax=Hibiscus sabdariffa TaxID=183260 RepID=A0ABR2SQY3_9ROSI